MRNAARAKRDRRGPVRVVGDPTDPRGMAAMLSQFLEYLRVRNYSERTVDNRRVYIEYFIVWCEERAITRPSEVTKPMLERYQRWLYHYRKENGEPLSFRGEVTRLMPLRAFFKWLARNNLILYNPASELELPRIEHRLPKHVLTVSEAEAVLAQPDVEDALGVRDRAILETFYSTGMRRMELAGLKLYDLDSERGTIVVRQGKGKKDRVIPIGERAAAWIAKYLGEVRPTLAVEPDDGILFLTNTGEVFGLQRLTQLVRGYVKASGIGKDGACHLFRHTMATLMLEGGADIRFIQQMLGHAKLETTEIYTRVSIRQLKAIHELTHPGAKISGPSWSRREEEPDEVATREAMLSAFEAEADEESQE
jgi:integrase/recombinase XerD